MNLKTLHVIILCLMFGAIQAQNLQWRLLPNSPSDPTGRLDDIYFVNENTGWGIGYSGKVFHTINGGNSWDTVIVTSALRSIGFFDNENGIIGTLNDDSNKILYKTSNHGLNWSAVTNLPNPRIPGICGICIVNENVAYACGRYSIPAGIIKTSDKGMNWIKVSVDSSMVTSLVDCYFWTKDSGIVVGGYSTTGNFFGSYSVVLKTIDGGITWQRVYLSQRQFELCWKTSFPSPNLGYVSIQRYGSGISNILKSSDFGNHWTEIPFRSYDQQGIGFLNETTGWVGGWTGTTYETTNGGSEWHPGGWGNNLNRIRFLNDTLGYGAGQRIYKYSRESVGINFISDVIPESYILQQNYPNPFNPFTKIKFDILPDVNGQMSDVKLIVYDILGKEVVTLVNEKLSPGKYEADFDGSNFASSIYFYKLEAGSFIETKRMMLLK